MTFRRMAAALAVAAGALPSLCDAQRVFRVDETTIAEVHAAMRGGRLTCRALVQAYLDRIAAYDKQGPSINAITVVNPDALATADSLALGSEWTYLGVFADNPGAASIYRQAGYVRVGQSCPDLLLM